MSFYEIKDGVPEGSLDIDNIYYDSNFVRLPEDTTKTDTRVKYGDIEVRTTPMTGGGGGFVIPPNPDNGIPNLSDYEIRNDSEGNPIAYNKNLLSEESESLTDMVDNTNNGRLQDVKTVKEFKFPENSDVDILIKKDDNTTSIKGLLEQNSVNDIFFSDLNKQVLQDTIRYNVHKHTQQVISEQSNQDLYIVMRSILLQYANFKTDMSNFTDEIKRLNKMVVDYCVENISSNVKQYVGYLDDLTRLPKPIDRPQFSRESRNFTYDISNLL